MQTEIAINLSDHYRRPVIFAYRILAFGPVFITFLAMSWILTNFSNHSSISEIATLLNIGAADAGEKVSSIVMRFIFSFLAALLSMTLYVFALNQISLKAFSFIREDSFASFLRKIEHLNGNPWCSVGVIYYIPLVLAFICIAISGLLLIDGVSEIYKLNIEVSIAQLLLAKTP